MHEQEKRAMIERYIPILENIAASILRSNPLLRERKQIEVGDLISEGFKGLLQALDRVDDTDPGLPTFLYRRIRGAMMDYIRSQGAYRRGQKFTVSSLDMVVSTDDADDEVSLGESLVSDQNTLVEVLRHEFWQEAMQRLDEQEQRYLLLYLDGRFHKKKDIARQLGVSPQRVTQIHQKIVEKIKKLTTE